MGWMTDMQVTDYTWGVQNEYLIAKSHKMLELSASLILVHVFWYEDGLPWHI